METCSGATIKNLKQISNSTFEIVYVLDLEEGENTLICEFESECLFVLEDNDKVYFELFTLPVEMTEAEFV